MAARTGNEAGYWVKHQGIDHYIPDRSGYRTTFAGLEDQAACGRSIPFREDGSDCEPFDPDTRPRITCAGCFGYRE